VDLDVMKLREKNCRTAQWAPGFTIAALVDQGKSIQSSVVFRTYSQFTTVRGVSQAVRTRTYWKPGRRGLE
jgi:hypothetical protein